MPAKRSVAASAKKKQGTAATRAAAPQQPRSRAALLLLLCLVLAAICLKTTDDASRASKRARSLWLGAYNLQVQNMHHLAMQAAPKPAPPVVKPAPPVLMSVVRYREGEQETLQTNLVSPLLTHYADRQPGLTALMIERRNAASRDVNVRLFMEDGSETSYLWPSTHEQEGLWMPEEEDLAQ